MKRHLSYRTIFIVIALACLGIFSSLMVNYASETTPRFLKERPLLIWVLIGLAIVVTSLLSIWHSNSGGQVKSSRSSQEPKSNPVKPSGPSKYDVFISYSSKDGDWVHDILKPELESHSFTVLTDQDFIGGALSIEQMAEGVEKSRHVLAVMTQNFMESGWTKFETAMAQTLNPDASMRKLIPVLKENCNIPLNLRILHYRDLRNDEEWDQLIEDLI